MFDSKNASAICILERVLFESKEIVCNIVVKWLSFSSHFQAASQMTGIFESFIVESEHLNLKQISYKSHIHVYIYIYTQFEVTRASKGQSRSLTAPIKLNLQGRLSNNLKCQRVA